MATQAFAAGIRNPNSATPQLIVSGQTTFITTGLTKQVAVTGITTVDAVIVSFAGAQKVDERIWCVKTQSTGSKITPTRVVGSASSGLAFAYIAIGH